MKIKFLENNSAEITQRQKATSKKINYEGRDYTYVGKSKENPSTITRVKAFFECFAMTLASCLVIPCFFKGFRKTFKNAGRELASGQEIVKYYAINPHIFSQDDKKTSELTATTEELFKKGLEDSKKIELD